MWFVWLIVGLVAVSILVEAGQRIGRAGLTAAIEAERGGVDEAPAVGLFQLDRMEGTTCCRFGCPACEREDYLGSDLVVTQETTRPARSKPREGWRVRWDVARPQGHRLIEPTTAVVN